MTVWSLADLEDFVRDRVPDLDADAVAAVAVEIWDEGTDAGNMPGDDWRAFLDGLSADLNEFIEVVQG